MLSRLFCLLIFMLSSVAVASNHNNHGGQALLCSNTNLTNRSLVAFFGQMNFGFTAANLGSDYQTAMNTLLSRMDKLNPSLASLIQSKLPEFEGQSSRLHGVDFINNQDWDDKIVPAGCIVKKVILHRTPTHPEDREYLINEDLWENSTPSTQATLVVEQLMLRHAFSHGNFPNPDRFLNISDVRTLLSYLISQDVEDKSLVDFLHFEADHTSLECIDFLGSSVVSDAFKHLAIPKSVFLCTLNVKQHIRIQNAWVPILSPTRLDLDGNLNVRSFVLGADHRFKLRNGQEIELGQASDSAVFTDRLAPTTLDSDGYPLSGYLVAPAQLTTINNEPVLCLNRQDLSLPNYPISLTNDGYVTRCTVSPNSKFGSLVILKKTDMQWCASTEHCHDSLTNYFDFKTGTGKFELNAIDPSVKTKTTLDLVGFKEGQFYRAEYDPSASDYGDYILTISDQSNKLLGNTINVFRNGTLASAELKESLKYPIYSYPNIELSGSGSCGLFSGKSFVSTIKLYPNGKLMEGVNKSDTTIYIEGSVNGATYKLPAKSWFRLDDRGRISNHRPLCQ
jgi:hypothetical protein